MVLLKHRRVKCFFDVLYLESTGIAHRCNDVEAHGDVNAEMFYVSIGCYDNAAYFLPVDGILRLDVFRVTSGFYFYEEVIKKFTKKMRNEYEALP